MCGIIGYIGPKSVVPVLIEGLKKLEYRGYDSAGVAVVDQGKVQVRRVKGKIRSSRRAFRKSPLDGAYGLGHTRWATHGRPSEENAHPHRDCIGPDRHRPQRHHRELSRPQAEAQGRRPYVPDRDRHRGHRPPHRKIFQGIARRGRAGGDRRARRRVRRRRDLGRGSRTRSSRPSSGRRSSSAWATASIYCPRTSIPSSATRQKVVFLEDGEMAVIDAAGRDVHRFPGTSRSRKRSRRIAWNPMMIEKRGFKHFMLKEIFEQPEVVRDTLARPDLARYGQGPARRDRDLAAAS